MTAFTVIANYSANHFTEEKKLSESKKIKYRSKLLFSKSKFGPYFECSCLYLMSLSNFFPRNKNIFRFSKFVMNIKFAMEYLNQK